LEYRNKAIDLETGKIRDFISGEWVNATLEEIEAVQIFARRSEGMR